MADLGKLATLAAQRRDLDAAIDAEMAHLAQAGVGYGDMATALGVSRQAARMRCLRRGIAVPEKPGKGVPVPLTRAELASLARAAAQEGVTVAELIRAAAVARVGEES